MMGKGFNFERELEICGTLPLPWELLDGKRILITGATGLVGKYLIQTLLWRNLHHHSHIEIIAVGRDEEKFRRRFSETDGMEYVKFLCHDVEEPFPDIGPLDYILHLASNTHPRAYATDPIGTEMTNILGTYHLLNLASFQKKCRFILASSGDVYGENTIGRAFLTESDCGYIDCNTLRAGYIEGKRASEALCNAFQEAAGADYVIGRLCRIYGPTMQGADSKAISQFILNAVSHEDIILKSTGEQIFSYLYVFDAVSALLFLMVCGRRGEAYNISDNLQTKSLKELAELLADIGEVEVVHDAQDMEEKKGASTFHDVRLDGTKLRSLGWHPQVEMGEGLRWTVESLKKMYNQI